MVETRDVRLTYEELTVSIVALRDEVKKRTRSINKAEANRRAGGRVQDGVLGEHYELRSAARRALEAFEVAREALRRQQANAIRERLGMEPLEGEAV